MSLTEHASGIETSEGAQEMAARSSAGARELLRELGVIIWREMVTGDRRHPNRYAIAGALVLLASVDDHRDAEHPAA